MSVQVVEERPDDFVDLQGPGMPEMIIDLRYATNENFVGRPVKGYENRKCWMTSRAADRLKEVAKAAMGEKGYLLVIYDTFRAVESVRDFQDWAADFGEDEIGSQMSREKKFYYPTLSKKALFDGGFISDTSSHCRGSTVDLTLLDKNKQHEYNESATKKLRERQVTLTDGRTVDVLDDGTLNMGSHFDFFDEASYQDSTLITDKVALANREYLRALMTRFGFRTIPTEWWHYTLDLEPYPDKAFDFRDC
jgi:D-alanyl-D-alanine dipeptidase